MPDRDCDDARVDPAERKEESQSDAPALGDALLPPVIVGEALVDCFAGRPPIVGGAPLNVAWNLAGLGHEPVFVSRLGQDDVGNTIASSASDWGISTEFMRHDDGQAESLPTGVVTVEVNGGQPSYDIVYPVAYDFLPSPDALAGLTFSSTRWLYLGSLAWRRPESHAVLDQWIQTGMQRFVDINLRAPWHSPDVIDRLATDASVLKLNDEELELLCGRPATNAAEIRAAVSTLRDRWAFDVALVTCGSAGAYAFPPNNEIYAAAPQVTQMADTVGAGDAFASAVIDGILKNRSWQTCLNQAVRFAARVCSIQGATTKDRSLYEWESIDEDNRTNGTSRNDST